MPPKCKSCQHPDVKTINSQIRSSVSLRNIALQFGMSHTAVNRHAETCLGLTIGALIEQGKIERAIDVHEEFREQLTFAKQLRLAAQEYLGNPNDPLRLLITPKAHEIEVTYFDHNDLVPVGIGETVVMKPKKKVAQLSVILEAVYADGNLEPDKYKVTTIDIRKFALDTINTTDTCIDKFAKLGGAYTQDKPNTAVIQEFMHKFLTRFEEHAKGFPTKEAAIESYRDLLGLSEDGLTVTSAIARLFKGVETGVQQLPDREM